MVAESTSKHKKKSGILSEERRQRLQVLADGGDELVRHNGWTKMLSDPFQ
jgi:hypothetical protein